MPFNFQWYDLRAFAQNERNAALIDKLYQDAVKEATRLAATVNLPEGKEFTFAQFPKLNKQIDDLFKGMSANMLSVVNNGTMEAWGLANAKNDALLNYIHKNTGIDKSILSERYSWGVRNNEALKGFQTRKTDGLNLSDRVWKYTEQSKKDFEIAIDLSLGEGKPATQLSRDVRSLLNEPDRMFRRVRDGKGVLRLSKAAQAYHPGQGVYRSSYKNAMRLARTEINMAYREADFMRWSQMDFVTGIEIRLSNNPNHCPVCESLAGKYPKDFKWVGFHPNCRCHAIPILLNNKDFAKLLHDDNFQPQKTIASLPNNFQNWYRDNLAKINRAKNLPYFIRDNKKII